MQVKKNRENKKMKVFYHCRKDGIVRETTDGKSSCIKPMTFKNPLEYFEFILERLQQRDFVIKKKGDQEKAITHWKRIILLEEKKYPEWREQIEK
jgi:hypothetical protein